MCNSIEWGDGKVFAVSMQGVSMKILLLISVVILLQLSGCATPNSYSYQPYEYTAALSKRDDAYQKKLLAEQRKELAKTKEELEDIIRELEAATEALRQAELEFERVKNKVATSQEGGGIQTGPRGGKYVITKSGKKRYVK